MIKAVNLKTERMRNPVGIDAASPFLSWNCEGALAQSAFQIQAVNEQGETVYDSGKTLSNKMSSLYAGEIQSRERINWTVMLWDENGNKGETTSAFFEKGLVESDWKAQWINPELENTPDVRKPASYLRKSFTVADTGKARLYITAHGIYNAWLNGKEVEGFNYAPGTSQYDKRLVYQTYDVDDFLHQGENTIIVTIGDGWYRGSVGNDMRTNTFGEDAALLCQLEINRKAVLISDDTWEASQEGPLGLNDHMKGEEYDARLYYSDAGLHWGEWLEPGTDTVKHMTNIGQHGEPEVATAYLAYGCRLAGELAEHLGKSDDAAFFAGAAEKAKNAYRYVFIRDGIIDSPRQCRFVRPIMLDLLSEEEKNVNAARLAEKVKQNSYHLNTGFLTTAGLCRAMSDNGQAETAYRLLLQDSYPGWLYPVTKGATTIWERWEGINENGDVKDSLNHYAYGAIAGWLFDTVCGIRLDKGKITIKPVPNVILGYTSAEYRSPFGTIKSAWKYEPVEIVFTVSIPCNAAACFILPDGTHHELSAGQLEFRIARLK